MLAYDVCDILSKVVMIEACRETLEDWRTEGFLKKLASPLMQPLQTFAEWLNWKG